MRSLLWVDRVVGSAMTLRELYNRLTAAAKPIYGEAEAQQIARMIMEEREGFSWQKLVSDPQSECEVSDIDKIEREIGESRPVQYIIGEAEFCDFRLVVREGVLIPRPESEELIRWIVSEHLTDRQLRIMDVGTGSGALAISLSRTFANSRVLAVDLSDEALAIARENVERLAPSVELLKGDALVGVECSLAEGKEFDIVVSNPPYIPQSELSQMRDNVVKHEPHLALFVPDDDPLIFYRAIAKSAIKLLKKGGKLYFEIHEIFAQETMVMLREMGYVDVRLRLDINDKARMICAQRE